MTTETGADQPDGLTPEQWERAADVFVEALARPSEDRGAWLARALADAPAVLYEVQAMLAAHERLPPLRIEERLLAPPVAFATGGGIASGARVGPYRIEALVGEGGMGEVYRAERADGEYRQTVALKVLRAGLPAAELSRRFQLERQILARLAHPNIVPILDGGQLSDGRPYLVMQYVSGVPITTYSDVCRLSVTDRLRLFRTVCDAVQYAHANLVVHRDLKPSNILVTDRGDIRLLDFGIAKLLAPEDADVTGVLTTQAFLLTPEHAAPEQLARRPITTATDVYALGVLLYELITGVRPFRAASRGDLYRAICELEPSRPSSMVATGSERRPDRDADKRAGARADAASVPGRRASRHRSPETDTATVASLRGLRARELVRQLRGDLDYIILMALRKEPARRYASAGQFGEDVTRFIDGRPVLARPDSFGYRARRFTARNRTAVSLAGLVALSITAGLIGTTSQAWRARAEATQAAADRDRAERVSALLVDMFRLSDPNSTRGQTVTAREVLARGAARIARDFADRPESQADLLTEVGQIYENLGLLDDANIHLKRAIELRRSVYGEKDARTAESLTRLAQLRTLQARPAEAIELARTAIAVLRVHDDARQALPMLVDAQFALGAALLFAASPADVSEAAEVYAEARSLLDRHTSADHARIAEAIYGLASAAHGQGRFDLADSLLQETIARYARLGGPPHPTMAASLHDLGMLRTLRRRPAEAESLLRHALELRREIYGRAHPAVAQTLQVLALSLALLGRYTDAVEIGNEGVAVADSVWGKHHMSAASARGTLAFILRHVDQGERALRLLQEARSVKRDLLGPHNPEVLKMEIEIAQAYASMGLFDQARMHLGDTLERVDAALGSEHTYRAQILIELAKLDFDAGRLDDAEAKARESIAITRKTLRPDHHFTQWATIVVAEVQTVRGRLAFADSLLRAVLEAQRLTPGERHPETAITLVDIADLETRLGRPAEAERHARAALAIFESVRERGPSLAEARSVLGAALAAQGRFPEAEPLLRGALETLRRTRGARPSQIEAAAARLDRLET